jgi:phospholipase/lecithinase/hemolysin
VKKRLGLAVLVASVACGVAPASAYTSLFAFGDSLSDAGNLFIATGVPGSPYFNGHFSNGPTWVEDLSVKLGLGTLTPSLAGGNDFAYGAAQSGETDSNPNFIPGTTTPNPTRAIDLDAQVAAYQTAHPTPVPGALYTLDIGANDIFGVLAAFPTNPTEVETVVSEAVANTLAAVTDLYNDGARDLLFFEVPDLGLAPQFFGTTAQSTVSGLALSFDQGVLAGLDSLEAKGLKVFDLQAFALLDKVVDDPAAFGFNPATIHEGCFDSTTDALCSTLPAVQNTYLFWDSGHPTAAGHLLTADFAYALVAPEPSTWAMMLIGFAGLGFAGLRTRRVMASRAS